MCKKDKGFLLKDVLPIKYLIELEAQHGKQDTHVHIIWVENRCSSSELSNGICIMLCSVYR